MSGVFTVAPATVVTAIPRTAWLGPSIIRRSRPACSQDSTSERASELRKWQVLARRGRGSGSSALIVRLVGEDVAHRVTDQGKLQLCNAATTRSPTSVVQ